MEEAGGQDWVAESRGTLGLGKALGLGRRGWDSPCFILLEMFAGGAWYWEEKSTGCLLGGSKKWAQPGQWVTQGRSLVGWLWGMGTCGLRKMSLGRGLRPWSCLQQAHSPPGPWASGRWGLGTPGHAIGRS